MTPLIVFIHVPKTAGSTVNAIMKGHSPNGRGHIEELLDEDMEFKKAVNNLDWMSGHVSRDRIAIRIREVSRRPVRFFACVRNATDHLASRSEEHTSELQSLMRISYAVFCLKKKNDKQNNANNIQ